jgi:hypothetical protein
LQQEKIMRRLALATLLAPLLAAGALIGAAQAGTYGCQDQDKTAANHNAEDPTRPGTIGGCGTNQYKLGEFQKNQDRLKNQQIMTGPKRLNNGDGL